MTDLIPEFREPNNLDATVFVFRHRETKEIIAHYALAARGKESHPDWEHVGTLEPRLWIQAHWDDAEKEREACARVCESAKAWEIASQYQGDIYAAAIRARGE